MNFLKIVKHVILSHTLRVCYLSTSEMEVYEIIHNRTHSQNLKYWINKVLKQEFDSSIQLDFSIYDFLKILHLVFLSTL